MIESDNLGALFHPAHGGDRLALTDCLHWDRPREYTHRELDALAAKCARGLLARGLERGQRVAIVSANRAEFLIAYLGALRAGLVAVPVNHRFPAETVDFILRDADVALVLHDRERAALLPDDLPRLDFDAEGADGFQQLLDTGDEHRLDAGELPAVEPAPDEYAMILYTSGSTGRPKGVPLTHAGHLWALRARLAHGFPFHDHRLLVAAPLYHMNALCVSLLAFAGCAGLVLLPQFDVARYLAAIERFRCTWITSVPTMLAMCLQHPELIDSTDLSSVRIVRMGSAPVSPKLLARIREAFAGAQITNGYGTTEAGPVVFGPREGRTAPDLSVGFLAPGVEVRLVDDDGNDADCGVLWQRTPALMPGYLNLPEKTREVLTDDGWYVSGDVFRRDEHGAYFFVGRADDMFNSSGENIYPGEVEAVLASHPAVADCCVVPLVDEVRGAVPVAFVVRTPGLSVDEQALKAHVLANAPPYQHPRRIAFVDSLPLAGPGKVDRNALALEAARAWT